MTLIYVLILLFVLLIGFQTYLAINPKKIIEGLTTEGEEEQTNTTQSYNVSEPNSSVNIESDEGTNEEMSNDIKKKFNDMQLEIDAIQTQVNSLVQQQADYAQELAGSTPADITGTDEETVENVEASINK